MVLAKHSRPSICSIDKLLPLGNNALEEGQLPRLEVVLGGGSLSNVDNVELEDHAQLLILLADILQNLLDIWCMREFADGDGIVVVQDLLVHLPEELVHPGSIGVVHPGWLLV